MDFTSCGVSAIMPVYNSEALCQAWRARYPIGDGIEETLGIMHEVGA